MDIFEGTLNLLKAAPTSEKLVLATIMTASVAGMAATHHKSIVNRRAKQERTNQTVEEKKQEAFLEKKHIAIISGELAEAAVIGFGAKESLGGFFKNIDTIPLGSNLKSTSMDVLNSIGKYNKLALGAELTASLGYALFTDAPTEEKAEIIGTAAGTLIGVDLIEKQIEKHFGEALEEIPKLARVPGLKIGSTLLSTVTFGAFLGWGLNKSAKLLKKITAGETVDDQKARSFKDEDYIDLNYFSEEEKKVTRKPIQNRKVPYEVKQQMFLKDQEQSRQDIDELIARKIVHGRAF